MAQPRELTADQLRRRANTSQFSFASTAEAPDLDRIIGQERAARAIEFGIDIPSAGYNVFATGPTGAGKTSIIRRYLERRPPPAPCRPTGVTCTTSPTLTGHWRCVSRPQAASGCATR